jgi:nitrate reductase gamma subunit
MHVDWNSLFSGFGGVIVGAAVTYFLQHRLLDKQLRAAKESQDAFMAVLTEFRHMMNTRLGAITSELGNAARAAEQREKGAG